ncbi:MAG: hypothetical protein AMXMBFR12_03330 [Candidatus Babeliales bacterium]
MKQILILIFLSSPLIAMQLTAHKYNQEKTNALMAILNQITPGLMKNAQWVKQIQQAVNEGADPNIFIEDGFFKDITLLNGLFGMDSMVDEGKLISILLQKGANPNLWVYESPLHCACRKGYIMIVRQLIEHNAKVDAKTLQGVSPLMVAVENKFLGIAHVLLQHGALGDIDFVDAWGKTPLSFARKNNLTDMVTLLEDYKSRK